MRKVPPGTHSMSGKGGVPGGAVSGSTAGAGSSTVSVCVTESGIGGTPRRSGDVCRRWRRAGDVGHRQLRAIECLKSNGEVGRAFGELQGARSPSAQRAHLSQKAVEVDVRQQMPSRRLYDE